MKFFGQAFGFVAGAFYSTAILAAPADLSAKWTVSEGLANPESALVDGETIFVSNVNGSATEKDGNGYLSKFTTEGKLLSAKWVQGLHAPKGMGSRGDDLWVTDIDVVVRLAKSSAKELARVPVAGAKFLNDIAIDAQGRVYVSDMLTSKIHVVDGETVSELVIQPAISHPNGLFVDGTTLYIATWGTQMAADFSTKTPGRLYAYDLKTAKLSTLSKEFGHLDGLVRAESGAWWISDWMAGKVFRLGPKTKSPRLAIQGLKSAADLGYASGTLYVPDMVKSELKAYQLPASN